MKLSGMVVVVIGGARGIGKEYCRALLQKGAKVCCGDVLDEKGRIGESDFVDEFGGENYCFSHCDITKDTDVKELFDRAASRFSYVDVLVNAAAVMSQKDWKKTIDVNVNGAIRATHEALERMGSDKRGHGGAIVMTSSMFAYQPCLACPTYGASSGMLISLMRSWSHDTHYETTKVRFNSICPGVVDTDLWGGLEADDDELLHTDAAKAQVDAIEKVTKGQCAAALLTLLEDDSLNGQNIIVSSTHGNNTDTAAIQYIGLE